MWSIFMFTPRLWACTHLVNVGTHLMCYLPPFQSGRVNPNTLPFSAAAAAAAASRGYVFTGKSTRAFRVLCGKSNRTAEHVCLWSCAGGRKVDVNERPSCRARPCVSIDVRNCVWRRFSSLSFILGLASLMQNNFCRSENVLSESQMRITDLRGNSIGNEDRWEQEFQW